MAKKNTKTAASLAREAIKIIETLNSVKPLYKQLDELTMQLCQAKEEDLQEYGLVLQDNFKEKNTVFRPTGVKRFELKLVE